MQKPPEITEIKRWLKENNPLGLFGGDFSIMDIDPKPWSGHFNFLKNLSFVSRDRNGAIRQTELLTNTKH